MSDPLADALRGLCGASVAVAMVRSGAGGRLFPDEAEAVARAVPARQAEFSAGREAARRAMQELGLAPDSVPMGADRAPIWPPGLVGSITHDAGACLAAVAQASDVRGLGIDLEPATPLPIDIAEEILCSSEWRQLEETPETTRHLMPRLIFAAKEASYKALYPLGPEVLGFDAMTIRPDPESGQFQATLTRAIGPFAAGTALDGRFAITPAHILAAMTLPRTAN